MKILYFEWDENNKEHIAKHRVEIEEAEQACKDRPFIVRGRDQYYLIRGRTLAGRYLFVVAIYKGNGLARIITARDMTFAEKRLYQEHR